MLYITSQLVIKILETNVTLISDRERCNCCRRPLLVAFHIPGPSCSKVDSAIHWITQLVLLVVIRWIAIYPVDSVIHLLNNRGQMYIFNRMSCLSNLRSKLLLHKGIFCLKIRSNAIRVTLTSTPLPYGNSVITSKTHDNQLTAPASSNYAVSFLDRFRL